MCMKDADVSRTSASTLSTSCNGGTPAVRCVLSVMQQLLCLPRLLCTMATPSRVCPRAHHCYVLLPPLQLAVAWLLLYP